MPRNTSSCCGAMQATRRARELLEPDCELAEEGETPRRTTRGRGLRRQPSYKVQYCSVLCSL